MENGYYGSSKAYYDKHNTEDWVNTEAYYFEVCENIIVIAYLKRLFHWHRKIFSNFEENKCFFNELVK